MRYEGKRIVYQGPFSKHCCFILILSGNYPVSIYSYHNSALLLIKVNVVYIFSERILSQLECIVLLGRDQSVFIYPKLPHTISVCRVERALGLCLEFYVGLRFDSL